MSAYGPDITAEMAEKVAAFATECRSLRERLKDAQAENARLRAELVDAGELHLADEQSIRNMEKKLARVREALSPCTCMCKHVHAAKDALADEPAPNLDRCLSCSEGVLDSRLGGLCGDHPEACPPAPPATEQRYWRVIETPGCIRVGQCGADGVIVEWRTRLITHGSVAMTYYVSRAEAEDDGRASGLPEWKP